MNGADSAVSNDADQDRWKNTKRILRLPTLEAQLVAWIRQVDQRKVLRCVDLKRSGSNLYARKSIRSLTGMGENLRALDIANISLNPKIRSRGWFTTFLEIVDEVNPWDVTYVEAVRNPRLAGFLPRVGFIEMPHENFYRPSKRWRDNHGWEIDNELAAKDLIQAGWPKSMLEVLESFEFG